jgi:hypothetical protein
MPRKNLSATEKDALKEQWNFELKRVFTVPAGHYYIGDLCYALDDSFYDGVFGGHGYEDGLYTKKENPSLLFAMTGTGGDGVFKGSNGWTFGVDAGIIGIASKELCSKNDGGHFVEFKTPARCVFQNLCGVNGGIEIETEDGVFYLLIQEYADDENEDGEGEEDEEF